MVLIKFGRRCHLETFAQGTLHMRTLRDFVENFEGDDLRHDECEGASIIFPTGSMLRLKDPVTDEWQDVAELSRPGVYRTPAVLNWNVFCLYGLVANGQSPLIDPSHAGWGDSFAVVTAPDQLIERIKGSRGACGQKVHQAPITYVDEVRYRGEVTPFVKRAKFAWQSEFRIALDPGTGATLNLNVGDLSDIVHVFPFAEIDWRIVVRQATAAEQL